MDAFPAPLSTSPIQIQISPDPQTNGRMAARHGAGLIRAAISQRGEATIIIATGASQFEMIEALLKEPNIAWEKVTAFHLDEYVGISVNHPASFRLYLWKRFHSQLPVPLRAFHYITGEGDPETECRRLNGLIKHATVDVCFAGVGENSHLAFNDPPADFETDQSYLVVELDEACRRQQWGEGWFKSFDEVPRRAISMSIRQILKAAAIIITAPDQRKAEAIRHTLEGEMTPQVPASILQRHANACFFLDTASASLLRR
jgi:glucosamine-6-phosphate deaminase